MKLSHPHLRVNYLKDFFEKPEKVFVAIAAVFGLVMIVSMPLFMVPDETVHFYRAYQVSEGHLLSPTVHGETGGIVPVLPSVQLIAGVEKPPLPRSEYFTKGLATNTKFVAFPSSALYSPVAYLPQAAGIATGRILHPSIGAMMLMGRLFNLIAYILLVYLAIRIARQGKWVYVVAALFPVAIQEAASLSTDVLTIGLAFVTIAFLHSLFLQKRPVSMPQYIYIALLAVGLGLTKQTNVIFLLPVIFLPKSILPSVWRKVGLIACGLGVGILTAIGWYAIIKFQHYELDYSKTIGIANIDQIAQLKHVIGHPLSFAKTLFRTYVFGGFHVASLPDFYWVSMYGFFSLFSYQLPIPFIALGYTVLLVAFLNNGDGAQRLKLTIRLASIQTTVFILSAIAIAGALYLVWTPVGAPEVAGMQGRYFIPLIPLLIPLFSLAGRWVKVSLDQQRHMGILVSAVSIINLSAMVALTIKYFA